jgi:carbon-monoxide dehydrogenase small subunit
MESKRKITVTVNQQVIEAEVQDRLLLSDFLRNELGLTGTHVGCEQGVCGACTILYDGQPARSCLLLAAQTDGHRIQTIESLASHTEEMHPLQQAFWESHALQCGFCTPGFLMTLLPFLADNPYPTETDVREAISGNICRCTGYQHIVDAVLLAAERNGKELS